MSKRLYPGDHPYVAGGIGNLARLLQARGDLAGAEPLYRESLEMSKRLFPGDHPYVATGLNDLASLLRARGDLAGAEALHREALEMRRRLFPGDHPDVASGLNNLAVLLRARDKPAEAESLARESVAMFERTNGKDFWLTGNARMTLGSTLTHLNRFAEAEPELVEAQRVLSTAQGVPTGWYKKCVGALVALYESWDKAEPGKGYDAKAAEWKAKLAEAPAKTESK
jgi:tetratricopeptide (TPR) repeat protein